MVLSVSERTFAQEVFQSSTPVLVHFWAPWCELVGVNADQNFKLAHTYRLTSLPTLILFEGEKARFRLEQYQGREELRRTLDSWMLAVENSPKIQLLQPQEVVNR